MSVMSQKNIFNININELIEKELTPNQYILAMLIANKDKSAIIELYSMNTEPAKINSDLFHLYRKGYLENELSIDEVIKLEELTIDLSKFENLEPVSNEKSFIEIWYSIFPVGVKTGGYAVRSGLKVCEKKMSKFMKEYPQFTEDVIIKATHNYINRFKKDGWRFIQTADYFIYKQDSTKTMKSSLAAECEAVLLGGNYGAGEPRESVFSTDI
jgi:hypothetical protein